MAKKLLLPIGLFAVTVISLLWPTPGAMLRTYPVIPGLVMTIFFINGYETTLHGGQFTPKLGIAFLSAVGLSLIAAPFLALGISQWLSLPTGVALGIMVMAAMPSTLSSGIVMTDIAKGNKLWALVFTMGLSGASILTIPFVLSITLSVGTPLAINAPMLLAKLLGLVLLPFLIAMGLRSKTSTGLPRWVNNYVPSSCVIMTVWICLSDSHHLIIAMPGSTLGLCLIATALIHGTLLIVTRLSGRWLGLRQPEQKAFVFTASQKTLPIAISVLASLNTEVGTALLLCMIFHFAQLVGDSLLASRWTTVSSAPSLA